MTESPLQDEGRAYRHADALALALVVVLVPGVWLLLGWRPSRLVSGYDAVGALAPMVQALVDARGDPKALAYRPEVMGGVALRETLGPQPLLLVPAALGLSATAVLNLATFLTQALLAFFGQRAFADLAVLLGRRRPSLVPAVAAGLVFVAFAPWVGWRVGFGHVTLLVGLLPFAGAFALAAAAAAGSLNPFLLVVAGLSTAISLPFVGQQIVLYGVVFGAPMVAYTLASRGGPPGPPPPFARVVRPLVLALLGGFLLAAPGFVPMLAHALSTDALRDLGGPTMTWSYLTANPLDMLTSLPWARPGTGIRADIQLHESNVPVGPLLLLLVLVPPRGRRVLMGVGLSAALAAVLAANLRPLSDLLLAIVPPLRSFRAPTRAFLPLVFVLPLLALAAVAPSRSSESTSLRRLVSVAAGLALFLALWRSAPLLREGLGWVTAAGLVWWSRGTRPLSPVVAAVLVAGLAGGSLGAFQERLLPYPDAEGLLAAARADGEAARRAEPGLAEPLTRVALEARRHDPDRPSLGVNRAFAAGLASLDGYAFPQRRFVALVRALRGEPYSPTALILRFGEAYAPSRILFQLYNAPFAFHEQAPLVTRRGETAGPAWFPLRIAVDPDLNATVAALLGWGDATHEEARRVLRLVGADPKTVGVAVEPSAACVEARVLRLERPRPSELTVQVSVPADCPLVLATNYAEELQAWSPATGAGASARLLRTFPAYGALLAVEVPAGVTRVEIRPAAWPPLFTFVLAVLGAGLIAASVVGLRRTA